MYAQSLKQLIVWQRSIELVKGIYAASSLLPKEEIYGLVSQMRRAAVSIPSNIAEGYKRRNLGEYVQFLSIADASAAELETQLTIAHHLKFIPTEEFHRITGINTEVMKMLNAMISTLKNRT